MSDHHRTERASAELTRELELSDFDADKILLSLPGVSLVIFTSQGCAACRYARERLPEWPLPVERLAWIDAADNGGLVQRYEVVRLPALFLVRDGQLHGRLNSSLQLGDLLCVIQDALACEAQELP